MIAGLGFEGRFSKSFSLLITGKEITASSRIDFHHEKKPKLLIRPTSHNPAS
jgi:hypothetical protein